MPSCRVAEQLNLTVYRYAYSYNSLFILTAILVRTETKPTRNSTKQPGLAQRLSSSTIMASTGALDNYEDDEYGYEGGSMQQKDPRDEELTVDDALEKLSHSLRDAKYAIPITHGAQFVWRNSKFQAHASPAQFPRDVQYVIDKLSTERPWNRGRYHPCAYRLSSGDPMIKNIHVPTGPDGGTAETLTPPSTRGSFEGKNGAGGVVEGCGDGGDPGAGDKLLHLLRRWDIQNVVLCVTCWDEGLRGRLGTRRFRLYLDCAKSVLEQCYMDSVSVASSAEDGNQNSRANDSDVGRKSTRGSSSSAIASTNLSLSSDIDSSSTRPVDEEEEDCTRRTTVRVPSIEREKWHGNNNQEESENEDGAEVHSSSWREGGGSEHSKMPRGLDLLRAYRQARERFMPERPRFRGLKHSVVDANVANIPQGEPDGLGGFGLDPKRKMGRVNHFLAAAPSIGDSGGEQQGYLQLGVQANSHEYYPSSSDGGMSSNGYLDGQQQPIYPLIQIPMPSITRAQLDEAKSVVRPHELTHCVYRCVAMLLGYRDTTWPGCRAMLASPNFIREIVLLQPLSIPFDEVCAVRDLLEELGPGFNPGNLQRQSILAANMLEWCIRVVRAYYRVATSTHGSAGQNDGGFMPRDDEEYSEDDGWAGGKQEFEGHRQSLPLRMLRMDPNPDFGKSGPAKSPISAPLHLRNDIGPEPIRSVDVCDQGRASSKFGSGSSGPRSRNSRGMNLSRRSGHRTNRSARSVRSRMDGWRGVSHQRSRRISRNEASQNGVEQLSIVSNEAMRSDVNEGAAPVRKW